MDSLNFKRLNLAAITLFISSICFAAKSQIPGDCACQEDPGCVFTRIDGEDATISAKNCTDKPIQVIVHIFDMKSYEYESPASPPIVGIIPPKSIVSIGRLRNRNGRGGGYGGRNEWMQPNAPLQNTWLYHWAQSGEIWAQANLGVMYREGRGTPKDSFQGFNWFLKAAAKDDLRSINAVADMLAAGEGIPKDVHSAIRWYEKAARKGDPYAMNRLADIYTDGNGVPKDTAKAIQWRQAAADKGDSHARGKLHLDVEKHEFDYAGFYLGLDAQTILDQYRHSGQQCEESCSIWVSPEDLKDEISFLQFSPIYGKVNNIRLAFGPWNTSQTLSPPSCERIRADLVQRYGPFVNVSNRQVGLAQEVTNIWSRSLEALLLTCTDSSVSSIEFKSNQDLEVLNMRAEGGDIQVMIDLARNHDKPYWFIVAAKLGHPTAMKELEQLGENGDVGAERTLVEYYRSPANGKESNYASALKWELVGAKSGDPLAGMRVAEMNAIGQGTPKNTAEAEYWLEQIALHGKAFWKRRVAEVFANGEYGLTINQEKAFKLYQQAAEEGDAMAQAELGDRYRDGKGVTQDYRQAVSWYERAASDKSNSGMHAMECLRDIYANGIGVDKNIDEANDWTRKIQKMEEELIKLYEGD